MAPAPASTVGVRNSYSGRLVTIMPVMRCSSISGHPAGAVNASLHSASTNLAQASAAPVKSTLGAKTQPPVPPAGDLYERHVDVAAEIVVYRTHLHGHKVQACRVRLL